MSTAVRRLSPNDWAVWREIRLRALAESPDAFGSTLERERRFGEHDWRLRLAAPSVVVESAGRPVACAAIFEPAPGTAAVVAMWVAPDHRGRGLCQRMLDRLVPWAQTRGDRVVLSVNRDNPRARAAYEAYGFAATGEEHPLREGSAQVCDVLALTTALPRDTVAEHVEPR